MRRCFHTYSRAACYHRFPIACLIIGGVMKICQSVKFYTKPKWFNFIYSFANGMYYIIYIRYLEVDWTIRFSRPFPSIECQPISFLCCWLSHADTFSPFFTVKCSVGTHGRRAATAHSPTGAAPLRSPLVGISCRIYFQQNSVSSCRSHVHRGKVGERDGRAWNTQSFWKRCHDATQSKWVLEPNGT